MVILRSSIQQRKELMVFSRIDFNMLNNVTNPNSIHGIYPYRGKISAKDAENIISKLPNTGNFLDPFCGSGTIVYEAEKHGLNAFGVDNNPLAITIAKAKTHRGNGDQVSFGNDIVEKAIKDLSTGNYRDMPINVKNCFHEKTAAEIMCVKNYFDEMNDFLKGVFFGTIALVARACNGYVWTSSTVGKNMESKQYVSFFEKFIAKIKKHSKHLIDVDSQGASTIISGDSRCLSKFLEPNSIDFVFTSPPYFDGLDYTAYYGKLIYEIFEVDRVQIKKNLIQHVDSYKADMKQVLDEIDIVTSDNALIVFVVGDKKVGKEVINGGDFFNSIKQASYILEREYTGSSSQVFDVLNNTKRKEQIVVWDKKDGKVIKYE